MTAAVAVAPPRGLDRHQRMGAALLATGVAIPAAIARWGTAWVPACPYHALTGWDCPGCGTTRSLDALVHGDLAGAVGHNALLVLVALPVLAVITAHWLVRRPVPRRLSGARAVTAWLVLVAVMTVARNLPGPLFEPLAAR